DRWRRIRHGEVPPCATRRRGLQSSARRGRARSAGRAPDSFTPTNDPARGAEGSPRAGQRGWVWSGPVPKRPPRVLPELPVPRDLRGPGPTRARLARPGQGAGADPEAGPDADAAPLQAELPLAEPGAGGELWRADVFELLGRLPD